MQPNSQEDQIVARLKDLATQLAELDAARVPTEQKFEQHDQLWTEVAQLERQLARLRREEYAVPLESPTLPCWFDPEPTVSTNGDEVAIRYLADAPGYDGTPATAHLRTAQGVTFAKVKKLVVTLDGKSAEEHALWTKGLRDGASFFTVHNSKLAAEAGRPDLYDYLLFFWVCTVDVVAARVRMEAL